MATSFSFYDTASRRLRSFVPSKAEAVTMYVCGPTVYDRIHLGNARSLVVFDVLYRWLRYRYGQVRYVRNITDVDDKIIARAEQLGISEQALITTTIEHFHRDMDGLGCMPPTVEPRVTEHMPEIQAMISELLSSEHAYIAEGHVIFASDRFADYGAFAHRSDEEILIGARVELARYKRNPRDFVLWKPAEGELAWPSPWGRGRPGWHIECSALSRCYLGEQFDIHGGGVDLVFPHHQNEIAQSQSITGNHFARYWFHVGYLTVDGAKMSKSLNNFITVDEALQRADRDALRYMLLQRHPTKPLDWTEAAMTQARGEVGRLQDRLARINDHSATIDESVVEALAQGLNLPLALQGLQRVSERHPERLRATAELLGLLEPEASVLPDHQRATIEALVQGREQARLAKDFASADQLRDRLQAIGVVVEDTKEGPRWRYRQRWYQLRSERLRSDRSRSDPA